MARTYIPTQKRYNDPYQQRVLQFETQDPRVYLSRVSNYLLKAIGNDVVISGLDVASLSTSDLTTLNVTLNPGSMIQDSTLIEVSTPITLSIDTLGFDSCSGYIIIYTSYKYLESIEANQLQFKMSYITNDGLLLSPITDPWDYSRDRLYLNIYSFSTSPSLTIREMVSPNYFYISGRKYYRRGKAKFIPAEDTTATRPLRFFTKEHDQASYKIFSQLYDNRNNQLRVNNLSLPDINKLKICIDEYKPFDNYYSLSLSNPLDVEQYTIESSQISSNIYTLNHNLNQQYFLAQLYDEDRNLIFPKAITYTSDTSLQVDFSNLVNDLAAKYYLVLVKNNIHTFDLSESDFIDDLITIQHNLSVPNPNVQVVLNSTNTLLNTNNSIVKVKDSNSVYINTTFCDFSPDDYTVIIHPNTLDLINIYTNEIISIPFHTFIRKFYGSDLDINNEIYITHDLVNSFPIVTVYDESYNIVLPDIIESIDTNTIKLYFQTISGLTEQYSVCVYSYDQTVLSYDNTDLDSITSELVVDLTGENIVNPIFQVYDQYNQLVIPENIIITAAEVYTFDFSNNTTIDNFNITIADGTDSSYVEFFMNSQPEDNKYQISHNLDTIYPLVQMYQDNYMIVPYNVKVLGSNDIELDLKYIDLSVLSQFRVNVVAGLARITSVLSYENCYIQEFDDMNINLNILTVNHNLNFQYPIVQIYDNTDTQINLSLVTIKTISKNQITVDFTDYGLVAEFHKIVIMNSSVIT